MSVKVKSRVVGIVLLGAIINKTGNVPINVTLRRLRVTIVVVEKQQVLRILSVCLQPEVYYSMQCACAILSSVACPVVQHFSALPRKRHDFRGQKKSY
jgi:hypothetical protein